MRAYNQSNMWCNNTAVALSISLFRENRYYNLLLTNQLFLILVDVNECWRMLTLLLLNKLFDVVLISNDLKTVSLVEPAL